VSDGRRLDAKAGVRFCITPAGLSGITEGKNPDRCRQKKTTFAETRASCVRGLHSSANPRTERRFGPPQFPWEEEARRAMMSGHLSGPPKHNAFPAEGICAACHFPRQYPNFPTHLFQPAPKGLIVIDQKSCRVFWLRP
jgi:hypothetical protein